MVAVDKQLILSWLVDEDYEVKAERVPPEAPIEWVLGVTVRAPVQVKLLVQKPKEKADRIAVTLGVIVSPAHKEALASRGPLESFKIMGRVAEAILSLCPDCIFIVQPSPAKPENIVVTKILYGEELSRTLIAKTIRILVNAYILIITIMNSELGTMAGQRPSSGPPSII